MFEFNGDTNHSESEFCVTRTDRNAESGPQKPNLKTIDVNLNGVLYTTKLCLHHFIKQNGHTFSKQQEDTCLILIGSGAAFLDVARTPQYEATKWAVRGIMHSLRRTTHFYGSRVNTISPWYVVCMFSTNTDESTDID